MNIESISRRIAGCLVSRLTQSDIQRHFLVRAPSVNQMMRTLERLGYISRAHDFTGQAIPRSIRVLVDLE